jgi:hypothetical protein
VSSIARGCHNHPRPWEVGVIRHRA